jgi:hypothetical protein
VYFDGLNQTGPTRYVYEAKDYRPEKDLRILSVEPFSPEPE